MAATVWKGQLAFGLVSVPVRLYRAARKEKIPLHFVAPAAPSGINEPGPSGISEAPPQAMEMPADDGEPAKAEPAMPVTRVTSKIETRDESGGPVSRGDLLRAHEVAPNQYVTFAERELRALRMETSSEMKIVRTVRLEEIDPVYFETSYYVTPDQNGERAYSLLFEALREAKYVALATVAMHGREHVVVIRPAGKGLLAHTMFYQDEIHAENEFEVKVAEVAPKELELAKTFVDAIAGPFAPEEFKDAYREKLRAAIFARVARGEIAPAAAAVKPTAPVIDIMEALRKSIESSRGAAQTEPTVARREPGKVTAERGKSRKRRA